MTHGFDDEGAKFDGHGNLKNWWAPQDLKKFQDGDAMRRGAILTLLRCPADCTFKANW